MDSIFAKTILFLTSILSVVTGPSYIQVAESELSFDFKTGGNYPIYYYLNVQNVGSQKARFDVSSGVNWIFIYREGLQQQTNFVSVELSQYAPINFVLEIHPERLEDKSHQAEISINAVQLQDYSVLDTKKISVVLNRNIQTTPIPVPSLVETGIPVQTLPASPTVSPTPVLMVTPKPQIPPSPTKIQKSGETIAPSPSIPKFETAPVLKPLRQFIESLRSLVRFLFRK